MGVIRSVLVKIGADISGLQNSLASAQSAMKNAGRRLSSIGSDLSMKISLPLAGIGVAVVKSAADFEQALSNIKAVTGSTAKEMESFKNLALKMGKDTKYSATEAANGIEELSKAGVSTKDILNDGLKGALSLATAGDLELAESAEIASTALNSFKADGLNMIKVANLLAGGANASATSVQELKFGLSQCAAVASGVGMTFDDVVTTLSVFANNGLKGSDAGTSLKTMLLNLQPSTDKQAKLFQKLNLINEKGQSVFFNTAGKLKSIADISGILQNRLKGMTDAQRLQTMETLFGTDAIRAANILYKEGADGVNNMKSEMGKVTAEQVATEKMNNFKGSVEQLKGSLETLGISIGLLFLPYLRKITDYLTDLTNKFTTIDPAIQKVILVVSGIAAAIGPVLMVLGAMSSGLSVLAGILGAICSPIGLVVVAIAGLVAGLVYLYNTNEWFKNTVLGIWTQIQSALVTIWNGIKIVAVAVFDSLRAFWASHGTEVMSLLQATWNTIQTVLSTVWTVISTVAIAIFGALQTFWTNHGEQIKNALTTAWSVIWSILQPIWNTILSVAMTVFGFLKDFFTQNAETIKSIYTNAFELIYQIIFVVCQKLQAFWEQWGPLITAIFTTIWGGIKVIVEGAWNTIKLIIQTAINLIDGIIRLALNLIKGNWSGVWDSICDIAKTIWNLITGLIQTKIDTFIGLFNNLKTNVLGIFQGIWNGVKGFINQIIGGINGMINALNGLKFSFPDWVPGLGGKGFSLSIPNVPMLANGGIVDKPTLSMVGEGAEPEAVMPLSKLDNMLGRNTGGGNIIQIVLDGRVIQEYVDNGLGSTAFSKGY